MTILRDDTLTAPLQQLKEEPILHVITISFSFGYWVIDVV